MRHGVVFVDKAPDAQGGISVGNSAPRVSHAALMDWPRIQTGAQIDPGQRTVFSSGNGLMRPLEATAQRIGVEILLEHRMVALHRDGERGRVTGVSVEANGVRTAIRARKGVFVGTGGSAGNVNFRRIFDPRLTEEYCGQLGEPWSKKDASGEIAAMKIGASLWGAYNQVGEFGAKAPSGRSSTPTPSRAKSGRPRRRRSMSSAASSSARRRYLSSRGGS